MFVGVHISRAHRGWLGISDQGFRTQVRNFSVTQAGYVQATNVTCKKPYKLGPRLPILGSGRRTNRIHLKGSESKLRWVAHVIVTSM